MKILVAMFLTVLISTGCSKFSSSSGDDFVGWWTREDIRSNKEHPNMQRPSLHITHESGNSFVVEDVWGFHMKTVCKLVNDELVPPSSLSAPLRKLDNGKITDGGSLYVRSTQEEIDRQIKFQQDEG